MKAGIRSLCALLRRLRLPLATGVGWLLLLPNNPLAGMTATSVNAPHYALAPIALSLSNVDATPIIWTEYDFLGLPYQSGYRGIYSFVVTATDLTSGQALGAQVFDGGISTVTYDAPFAPGSYRFKADAIHGFFVDEHNYETGYYDENGDWVSTGSAYGNSQYTEGGMADTCTIDVTVIQGGGTPQSIIWTATPPTNWPWNYCGPVKVGAISSSGLPVRFSILGYSYWTSMFTLTGTQLTYAGVPGPMLAGYPAFQLRAEVGGNATYSYAQATIPISICIGERNPVFLIPNQVTTPSGCSLFLSVYLSGAGTCPTFSGGGMGGQLTGDIYNIPEGVTGTAYFTAQFPLHELFLSGSVSCSFRVGAPTAPTVVVQPANRSVTAGQSVMLQVEATGIPSPGTFQWQKNGTALVNPSVSVRLLGSGNTVAELTLPNPQVADSGNYTVVIGNSAGTVTSAAATVVVTAPPVPSAPTITSQPQAQNGITGGTVTFAVVASGYPFPSYQWRWNGIDYPHATGATLTLTNLQDFHAGSYSVVVTNSQGSVASVPAILALTPRIVTHPANKVVTLGQTATLSVTATGSPTPTFQWIKDGVQIPGATQAALPIGNATALDSGRYWVTAYNSAGSCSSEAATLTVMSGNGAPLLVTELPFALSAVVGGSVSLAVSATGLPTLQYQWRKNGVNLVDGSNTYGANGSTLQLWNLQTTDSAQYTVVVSNGVGTAYSNCMLLVAPPSSAPTITLQPQSQSVILGGTVSFSVSATGYPVPTYQWRKDGVDLPNATNATFTLSAVQSAHAGAYSVLASNGSGTTSSGTAMLVVSTSAPAITSSPMAFGSFGRAIPTYTITATNPPHTSYAASTLPSGLSLNATTGAIIGTPYQIGVFPVVLTATSGSLSGSATVSFSIGSASPVVPTPMPPNPEGPARFTITSNSFLAGWTPVQGAYAYQLDVATTATFAPGSFVPGYNDRTVTYVCAGHVLPATSIMVTNLDSNTTYHYRVRAVSDAGTSLSSPGAAVTTRHVLAALATSDWLFLDVPVDFRQPDGTWVKIYDGIPDEIIRADDAHGLTYYTVDWRYTGGSVSFNDWDMPINDWWYPHTVVADLNGDGVGGGIGEDPLPAPTPWWLAGNTIIPYWGETFFRLGVEFNPQVGQTYDICYSRNDVVSGATLSAVNGGGGIIGESTARLFLILFNEFTGAELDRGSLYLVRRTFAPAGVLVSLPVIGDVVLRKGNNGEVTGAITVLGDVTLQASATTTTISKLNGGSVTVKNGTVTGSLNLGGGHVVSASAGGITLTTASGVTIGAGPGGITMTIPGGGTATISTAGAVTLNLPLGVATALKNAANQLGSLLGLGVPNGPQAVAQVVGPGAPAVSGGWGALSQIALGTQAPGDYDVWVKENNAEDTLAIPIPIRVRVIAPLIELVRGNEILSFLRVGRWGADRSDGGVDGYELGADGAVINNVPPDNFIDKDPERFYVRLSDSSKNTNSSVAETVTVKIGTFFESTAVDDDLTEITLKETTANSGVFLSESQMIVAPDIVFPPNPNTSSDDKMPVATAFAPTGTTTVADDQPNDRTHRATVDGTVKAAYQSAGGIYSVILPVCNRSPDERRTLHVVVHTFNEPWRDANGNGVYDVGEEFLDISAGGIGATNFTTTGTWGSIWSEVQVETAIAALTSALVQARVRALVTRAPIHYPVQALFAQPSTPTTPVSFGQFLTTVDDVTGTLSRDVFLIQSNFRSSQNFTGDDSDDVVDVYLCPPFRDGDYGWAFTPRWVSQYSESFLPYSARNILFVSLDAIRNTPMTLAHEVLHTLTNAVDAEGPSHILFPDNRPRGTKGATPDSRRRIQETSISTARSLRPPDDASIPVDLRLLNKRAPGNRLLRSP